MLANNITDISLFVVNTDLSRLQLDAGAVINELDWRSVLWRNTWSNLRGLHGGLQRLIYLFYLFICLFVCLYRYTRILFAVI